MEIKANYPPVDVPDSDVVAKRNEKGEILQLDVKVGNYLMPKMMIEHGIIPDLRENIKNIKNMDAFDDDVLICAPGKAGTHWVWEIATMLTRGCLEYETRTKESLMLEFKDPKEFVNETRPRILNTHLPFENLPRQMLEKRCKIFFIQRNPKDILVSSYCHLRSFMPPGAPDLIWEDHLYCFFTGQGFMNPVLPQYILEFEEAMTERSDHILDLFYEDLKKDAVSQIKRIAQFLKAECSDDFAKAVAEKCSFKNMKEADRKKDNHFEVDTNFLYRKGEVGDWKNWFTVAQNERMDAYLEEHMKGSKLKYTYTM